jgi:hypothetical protein
VTVVRQGAYGKPRPALVIQSDLIAQHPSVTILPVTSTLRETQLFRVSVTRSPDNGLRKPSHEQDQRLTRGDDPLDVVEWALGSDELTWGLRSGAGASADPLADHRL